MSINSSMKRKMDGYRGEDKTTQDRESTSTKEWQLLLKDRRMDGTWIPLP